MSAVLRLLPKCLLAMIALCIVGGQFHRLECQLTGCPAATLAHHAADNNDGDPAAPGDDGHCTCQCHFTTLVPVPAFTCFALFLQAQGDDRAPAAAIAPDAPCLDIEHPPQLRCA